MWILSIHWIFIIFLFLHLIFPSAIFCHNSRTFDLHIVNNELISKERILLLLTIKVFDRNQHFFDLLKNIVLFVYSFIYYHLIRLILRKQKSLQAC